MRWEEGPGGEPRYAMLETIREFGLERLEQADQELEPTQRRHAAWYLALAEQAEPELLGPQQVAWVARLQAEHDNFRVALGWCLARGNVDVLLRMSGALWRFWYERGHATEGRQWLARALADDRHGSTAARAKALLGLGHIALGLDDCAYALSQYQASLELQRALGDKRGIANALHGLGRTAIRLGDYGAALKLHQEGLEIRRELNDQPGVAVSYHNLGEIASLEGDFQRAREMHEHALAIRQSLGDVGGVAHSVYNLGKVASYEGDMETARRLFEGVLTRFRDSGDQLGVTYALSALAGVELNEGRAEVAIDLLQQSLRLRQQTGDSHELVECMESLAAADCMVGQTERGALLLGAMAARREALGTPLPPVARADYERTVTRARADLGATAFAAAWERGRALSIEQAMAVALTDTDVDRVR